MDELERMNGGICEEMALHIVDFVEAMLGEDGVSLCQRVFRKCGLPSEVREMRGEGLFAQEVTMHDLVVGISKGVEDLLGDLTTCLQNAVGNFSEHGQRAVSSLYECSAGVAENISSQTSGFPRTMAEVSQKVGTRLLDHVAAVI